MVDSDSAVRRLTREAGNLLQPYGFHGGDGRWVHLGEAGVATIRRTRVQRTWTDGQQVLRFGLELTATPRAWWEFRTWRDTRHGLPATPLDLATGPGLLDTHGLPADCATPWTLRVDPTRPGRHAHPADLATLRADLPRRLHTYARRALRLLDPLHHAHELHATHPEAWEPFLVLLATQGPTPELDVHLAAATDIVDVLAYLDERCPPRVPVVR
ncbi:hypothetical protein [Nocardia sp. SSK8]|uniref:hypothetical protein n=1 Tax=Nocardia sp. SSK8 TaxID=3120154 RepID=UPI00300AEF3A